MAVLRFDLRQAIAEFEARTGLRITYEQLSDTTGLSVDTLKSLANRSDYNVTLRSISEICSVLGCDPRKHLHWSKSEDRE
ncbi:MAG: helix-turn-helix transcriptional regulator [Calothrix sp. SM1_5_4]|nr:helix-turn-helix transcriptional regulator [Calothrix sp. SM1_5_4]